MDDLPGFHDVVAAHGRIAARIVHTPVLRAESFERRARRTVLFKCENLQRGGAFKLRGAMNALRLLPRGQRITAVATHSSGNHGAALAIAAREEGLTAFIVMPEDSARPKIAAVERSGGHIVFCRPGLAAREAALAELLERERAHVVHPFDDARVIAGQGTAALELLSAEPELEAIVAPVGGGGLIGGTALAARAMSPRCHVIGAEPARADDARRSFLSGERQSAGTADTIADGLRSSIGERNFALLRSHVDDVVTVSEAEIIAAMRILLEDAKLLVEPSAAVAVAAVLAGRVAAEGARIGVILSGGNVDLERCPFLRGAALAG